MGPVLETVMLICFGFSWPLSVIRNYRSKTAKSMSLPFILMIIVGYAAGLAAIIISHSAGYVLIVYFFNLLMVLANLVIYFINRRADLKMAEDAQPIRSNNTNIAESARRRAA